MQLLYLFTHNGKMNDYMINSHTIITSPIDYITYYSFKRMPIDSYLILSVIAEIAIHSYQ